MTRHSAEKADINPRAAAFERAKLAMSAEERAFEDWWTAQPDGSGVGAYSDLARAAQNTHRSFARLGWMARVREVDRLKDIAQAAEWIVNPNGSPFPNYTAARRNLEAILRAR